MDKETYQQVQALSRMTVGELRERYIDVFGEETRSHHKDFLLKRIIGRKAGGNIAALTGAEVIGITQALDGRQHSITCADSVTVDWSAGGTQYMTFDRDTVTMSFSNPTAGGVYRLLLQQSSGGSDSITWSTTIKWRGGSAPTLTAAGNAVDILTFTYINSAWYGDIALNFV